MRKTLFLRLFVLRCESNIPSSSASRPAINPKNGHFMIHPRAAQDSRWSWWRHRWRLQSILRQKTFTAAVAPRVGWGGVRVAEGKTEIERTVLTGRPFSRPGGTGVYRGLLYGWFSSTRCVHNGGSWSACQQRSRGLGSRREQRWEQLRVHVSISRDVSKHGHDVRQQGGSVAARGATHKAMKKKKKKIQREQTS